MEWILWILLGVGVFSLYFWLKSPKPKDAKEKRSFRRISIIGWTIAVLILGGLFWTLIQGGCHWTSTDWWCI